MAGHVPYGDRPPPTQPYRKRTEPSYPAQSYPAQSYPEQPYPGESYPTQPYPAQPEQPVRPTRRPQSAAPHIAVGRLWATGLATALVAALAAVVAMILIRGVLNIPVFAPGGEGAWGNANTGYLAALSALAALAATGLLHLLLVIVARPRSFFAWIAGLATAALMLLPLTTGLSLAVRVGSAAVFLIIGVTITCLLYAIAPSVVTDRDYREL